MSYAAALALGVGWAVSIAVIGAGVGQGLAAQGALGAIGRQPDAIGDIQRVMLIAMAMIESLVIYAFVIALILLAKLPPSVMDVIKATTGH